MGALVSQPTFPSCPTSHQLDRREQCQAFAFQIAIVYICTIGPNATLKATY